MYWIGRCAYGVSCGVACMDMGMGMGIILYWADAFWIASAMCGCCSKAEQRTNTVSRHSCLIPFSAMAKGICIATKCVGYHIII